MLILSNLPGSFKNEFLARKHNFARGLEVNPPPSPFFLLLPLSLCLQLRLVLKLVLAFTFLMEIISKWKSPVRHGRKKKQIGESKLCNL